MNDNSKFVGALLLGAAAGAAISLFITSENGHKLRQMVSEKAGDLMNDLKEKAEEGKGMVAKLTDKVVAATDEIAKKASGAASAAKTESNMYI